MCSLSSFIDKKVAILPDLSLCFPPPKLPLVVTTPSIYATDSDQTECHLLLHNNHAAFTDLLMEQK